MQEEEEEKLERRMGLYDLLAVGIGGTVGSGVFVLAGEIANAPDLPAGPSVVLSFAAAGLGCVLSGLSFAELASRIHADGSSYIYAYVNLGEVFAFVAGWYVLFRFLDGGIGKGKANSFLRLKMGQHVYVCPTNSNLSPKIVRQPHIYIHEQLPDFGVWTKQQCSGEELGRQAWCVGKSHASARCKQGVSLAPRQRGGDGLLSRFQYLRGGD